MSGAQKVILAAWITSIALASVKSIAKLPPEYPRPASFLGLGVAYTMLYGLAGLAPGLAAVLAIGLDIALITPADSPLNQLAQFLQRADQGIATSSASGVNSTPTSA